MGVHRERIAAFETRRHFIEGARTGLQRMVRSVPATAPERQRTSLAIVLYVLLFLSAHEMPKSAVLFVRRPTIPRLVLCLSCR